MLVKNEIKIERGIAVPATYQRNGFGDVLGKMKVNESFVTPMASRQAVFQAAHRLKDKLRIVTRAVSQNEVRVWRVK